MSWQPSVPLSGFEMNTEDFNLTLLDALACAHPYVRFLRVHRNLDCLNSLSEILM